MCATCISCVTKHGKQVNRNDAHAPIKKGYRYSYCKMNWLSYSKINWLKISKTGGAFDSAKNRKRQRRKRQSVTANRGKSRQTL